MINWLHRRICAEGNDCRQCCWRWNTTIFVHLNEDKWNFMVTRGESDGDYTPYSDSDRLATAGATPFAFPKPWCDVSSRRCCNFWVLSLQHCSQKFAFVFGNQTANSLNCKLTNSSHTHSSHTLTSQSLVHPSLMHRTHLLTLHDFTHLSHALSLSHLTARYSIIYHSRCQLFTLHHPLILTQIQIIRVLWLWSFDKFQ